jgi:methylated-DNA-[protein]-cysteine S-methyltransferase
MTTAPLSAPTGSPPPDALVRLAARAASESLIDVAYALVDSPVGRLVAAATPRGLARLAYEDFNGGLDEVLDQLARRLSPRILEAPARLEAVRRELDEYFDGRRTAFSLPLDLGVCAPFGRRVLEAATAIPFGATRTYREVAEIAGNPAASRATGNALGANPIPIVVPCHRVLRSGGGLGGYTGGLHRKEQLLALEGVLL